ncbi:hypothetical protein FKM82_007546 [Ascaphus truei]
MYVLCVGWWFFFLFVFPHDILHVTASGNTSGQKKSIYCSYNSRLMQSGSYIDLHIHSSFTTPPPPLAPYRPHIAVNCLSVRRLSAVRVR